MLFSTIKQIATTCVENFDSDKPSYARRETFIMALINLVFLVLVILILAFIGTALWNRFLAGQGNGKGAITCVKELKNFWEILGVYIIVQLLFGGL